MNQCERLLKYLQDHNTIDPLQAWNVLGIYRLSARINDLRKLGHNIETNRKKVTNRFEEKISVANYQLMN